VRPCLKKQTNKALPPQKKERKKEAKDARNDNDIYMKTKIKLILLLNFRSLFHPCSKGY
jgi:hypothetical protein